MTAIRCSRWSSSYEARLDSERPGFLIPHWGTEILLIITYLTHCYIWRPMWSLSSKRMRTCFLLWGWMWQWSGVLSGVVMMLARWWETSVRSPIEAQNFFGSLIVTYSIHCYITNECFIDTVLKLLIVWVLCQWKFHLKISVHDIVWPGTSEWR